MEFVMFFGIGLSVNVYIYIFSLYQNFRFYYFIGEDFEVQKMLIIILKIIQLENGKYRI